MRKEAPTPFVVLTTPRTGSAWVIDSLHSHPDVVAYPELFTSGGGSLPYAGADIPRFEDYVSAQPGVARAARSVHRIAYLRKIYRDRPGVCAVGFKLMYAQARRQPGLLPYLALRRARVIHLIRANSLEALISYQSAKATGIFHPMSGDEAVERAAVTLDVAELRERLERHDLAVARSRATVERYRLPRLEIAYEELVGRQEETFGRILRFLDVEPGGARLASTLVRTGTGRNVDLVENMDAVGNALRGTRFEWMLGSTGAAKHG